MNIIKLEHLKKLSLPAIVTIGKPGTLLNVNISKLIELINDTLPFPINFRENNRFILNDLNSIMGRGHHSNNNISEIFICLSGSCTLELFDGLAKSTFTMKKNEFIYIPNNIWLDFYNFINNTNILVLTSKIEKEVVYDFFIKSSIYNMAEYLTQNDIPIEKINSVYLEDYLIIEHVITIFWNDSERFLLTKKVFDYYKDLRQVFFYSHKMILNFTVVGSNGDESLKVFNDNLAINDGIFNDTYIEFDQSKYDISDRGKRISMLDAKWREGLTVAAKKHNNIIVMRGSNDIVDPFIYIQIQQQYNPHAKKLYVASKTIPQLDIFNIAIVDWCKKINDDDINIFELNNNTNIIFNNQYPSQRMCKMSISTIAFLGFSSNIVNEILNKTENKKILANEIILEMFVRKNVTNHITLTQDTFFLNPKITNKKDNITQINNIRHYHNIKLYKINTTIKQRINNIINYFNNEKNINILETIIKGYCNRGVSKEILSDYEKIIYNEKYVYYKPYTLNKLKELKMFKKYDD